jgi:hypothetical protein
MLVDCGLRALLCVLAAYSAPAQFETLMPTYLGILGNQVLSVSFLIEAEPVAEGEEQTSCSVQRLSASRSHQN